MLDEKGRILPRYTHGELFDNKNKATITESVDLKSFDHMFNPIES